MTYTSLPRALLFSFTKIFSFGNWMISRGLRCWSRYSAIFCARSGEPEPAYNLMSPYIFISSVCSAILNLFYVLCLFCISVHQKLHRFIGGDVPLDHISNDFLILLLRDPLHKAIHQGFPK